MSLLRNWNTRWSMTLITRRNDWQHYCYPPNPFVRWLRRIGPGSIWECKYGHRYKLYEDDYSGFRDTRWVLIDDEGSYDDQGSYMVYSRNTVSIDGDGGSSD